MPLIINNGDPLAAALTYLIAVEDDNSIKFIKGGLTPVVGSNVTIQPGTGKLGRAFRTGQSRSIESLVTWAVQTFSNNQDVTVFVAHNGFNSAGHISGAGGVHVFTPKTSGSATYLGAGLQFDVTTGKAAPSVKSSTMAASELTGAAASAADIRSTSQGSFAWRMKGQDAASVSLFINGLRDGNFASDLSNVSGAYGYASAAAEFQGVGGGYYSNTAVSFASFDYVYIAVFVGTKVSDADIKRLHDSLTGSNAFALTGSATPVAPTITTQPSAQSVAAGGTATFTVAASGYPAPTYQWQRSTDGGTNWADIASATNASYTTPATTETGGTANNGDRYRCVVTNSQGAVTSSAVALTVTAGADATPPVLTGSIVFTDITQTTFVGTVTPATDNSGGAITYDYSINGGASWLQTNWPANTYNFVGLAGGTTYQVRVRARDAAGNYSNVLAGSVTTAAGTAGTITGDPLALNNDGAPASTTLAWVTVMNEATGAFVLTKNNLNLVNNRIVITDSALAAGTNYRVTWRETGGNYGCGRAVAA